MSITSTQNPLIKDLIALREPKARHEQGLTIIDGFREITRALAARITIEKLIYCPKLFTQLAALQKLTPRSVQWVEVADKVFEKIAYGNRHDGVMAIVKVPEVSLTDLKLPDHPMVVVVESVEKPGNLGAILRTCDGAGVNALIVCDPKTDLYNPNVIRASVGTIFSVPTVVVTREEAAAFLKKKNIKVLGAFPDVKETHAKANLKGPLAIVLGAEDEGLSPFWQKHCDVKVKIPMYGIADSLNVSVSAAIIIYEALRQRS